MADLAAMESTALSWRKSSYAGNGGANCVDAASRDRVALVRDTKANGNGPVHRFTLAEWHAFVAGVRNGEFDLGVADRLV